MTQEIHLENTLKEMFSNLKFAAEPAGLMIL
jgi:hypothetical protein